MQTLIDVHAHICDPIFDPDRAQVLDRAAAAGITRILAVGENLLDAARNLELAAEDQRIWPAAGLYPTFLDLEHAETMRTFIRRHRARLVAIGEVGLDYWQVKEEKAREIQRKIFTDFIALAEELDLPLNVHSRSAGRHAVQLLLERRAERVILHAFDGRASAGLPAVEAGYFFSVPPSVVRSRQKQKLLRHLPLSCLLVETDSPVLGPEAGMRNEPANGVLVVEAIAAIKGITQEEVLEAVTHNSGRLFPGMLPR